MENVEIDRIDFEGPAEPYHGFTIRASYLKGQSGDALVHVEAVFDAGLLRDVVAALDSGGQS